MMDTMTDMLRKLERYARLNPPDPYWLQCTNDIECACYTFCRKCAETRQPKYPESILCGGYTIENDGCVHCEDCGKLLAYTLTDYGVFEELEHYRGRHFRKKLSREDVYHIARVVEIARDNPEVIRLARRALANIERHR